MAVEIEVAVSKPYRVLIGSGVLAELSALIPAGTSRIAVIHASGVRALASQIASSLNALSVEVPDSEAAKTADVLFECWERLGEAGFTRNDCIVTVGGGATTDLGGFVAATWLRGIAVVHVPTSLLGMVDAAVGGKTGINTRAGKNLVGAFHHPNAVLCDLSTLESLPLPELRQGLAEVVKCGFIADPQIIELLQQTDLHSLTHDSPVLEELVARAVRVKAEVVADDFTESKVGGLGREVLNYGHTLGHAIERHEEYRWRHGNAISVGMIFVAELSHLLGRLSAADRDLHRDLLSGLGLPVSYPSGSWQDLRAAMDLDKKTRGSQLRFIVLDAMQRPAVVAGPTEESLREALSRIEER